MRRWSSRGRWRRVGVGVLSEDRERGFGVAAGGGGGDGGKAVDIECKRRWPHLVCEMGKEAGEMRVWRYLRVDLGAGVHFWLPAGRSSQQETTSPEEETGILLPVASVSEHTADQQRLEKSSRCLMIIVRRPWKQNRWCSMSASKYSGLEI